MFFPSCLQNVWNLTDNHKKFLSLANPCRNLTALLGKQSWGISQINLCGRKQATATYMTTVHVESWVHFFHEMYLPNWLLCTFYDTWAIQKSDSISWKSYDACHRLWQVFAILWQLSNWEIWQQILQLFSGSNLCPYSRQILSVCLRACYIFCFAVGDRFRCVLHAELCLIFCFSHYFLKKRKSDSFNNGQLTNKDIMFFL